MPTDYQCDKCNLVVQVGWFHFHNSDDGYWAATLGFCQRCGTIHYLKHSSIAADADASLDRMFAQPGPLSVAESNFKGINYRIPLVDWIPVGHTSKCGHCGEMDQLLFQQEVAIDACPRCHSKYMRELNSWMT